MNRLIVAAVAGVVALAAGAYDGRITGNDWGSASSWEGGQVINGPGTSVTAKRITVYTPSPVVGSVFTNVTVGSLNIESVGLDNLAGSLVASSAADGSTLGSFIFDSGNGSDSLLTVEPALKANGSAANYSYNLQLDLLLKNNLEIQSLRTNDHDWLNSPGRSFLRLTGDIGDGGAGYGLTLNSLHESALMSLLGENDFTGDVTVRKGILQLLARDRATGAATQLGHDNTICVENGGTLDIGNYSFGDDQDFELAGFGYNGGTDYNGTARPGGGALAVSGQNRTDTPEIKGAVTLKADAGIGTGARHTSRGEVQVGNNVLLSGPVTDGGEDHSLVLLGSHKVTLTNPANSFKSLIVSNGLVHATRAAALGTRDVRFCRSRWMPNSYSYVYLNGGFALDPDFDITDPTYAITLTSTAATWSNAGIAYKALDLAVEDGDVTLNFPLAVTPGADGDAQPPLLKYGSDRLTLKRLGNYGDVYAYGGALTLDYAAEDAFPETLHGLYSGPGVSEIELKGGETAFTTTLSGFGPKSSLSVLTLKMSGAAGSLIKKSPFATFVANSVVDVQIEDEVQLIAYGSYLNDNLIHPMYLWRGGEAFCKSRGYSWDTTNTKGLAAFDAAVTTWETDSSVADAAVANVDVKDDIATTVPAGARTATLRFCDPNVRALDLEGRLSVMLTENSGYGWGHGGGAILVTPQMGAGDVEIRGGELTGTKAYDKYLYIHQWNTNATLVISSDLVNPEDGTALSVIKTGPGRVLFSGTVQTTGEFVILGGEVAFASPACWPTKPSKLRMMNGATLTLKGSGDYGTVVPATLGMGLSTVNVEEAGTTFALSGNNVEIQQGIKFAKTGAGTLDLSGVMLNYDGTGLPSPVAAEFDFAGGTVQFKNNAAFSKLMRVRTLVRCRNNVRLEGPALLNTTTTEGGVAYYVPSIMRQCLQIKVEGDETTGATFDLCGSGLTLGFSSSDADHVLQDTFFGEGRITVVDSSGTGYVRFGKFYAPSFTGVFDVGSLMDKTSKGGGLPNAILHLNGSVIADDKGYYSGRHDYIAFGGVSGTGVMCASAYRHPARVVIGRDRDETVTFDGVWNEGGYSPKIVRYVKRGTNAQAFTCPTNAFSSGWDVRGGELRASGAAGAVPTTATSGQWGSSDFDGTDLSLDEALREAIDGNDASKGVNAFTGSSSKAFSGTGVSAENPVWCSYAFKYPQRVNAIGLQASARESYPLTWEVYASNDGQVWTKLATVTTRVATTYGSWWTKTSFVNISAWRQYKISVIGAQTTREDADFTVGKFSLHGVKAADGSVGEKAIAIGVGPDDVRDWIPATLGAAGGEAAFLAGTPVTNGNDITFGSVSATAVVGTAHASGTSVFTSDLDLSRTVTFHAEGASEAVFTGAITGSGAMRFTGTGRVRFQSPVAPEGTAWTMDDPIAAVFDGGLALPAGATLDLSGLSGKLQSGTRYELIKTPGGVTGSFSVSGVPDKWQTRWKHGVLSLSERQGFVLTVR